MQVTFYFAGESTQVLDAPECPFECGWGGAKAKRAMPKCPPREFEGGFPIHKADFELCEWDIQSAAVVEGVWDAALSRPE